MNQRDKLRTVQALLKEGKHKEAQELLKEFDTEKPTPAKAKKALSEQPKLF